MNLHGATFRNGDLATGNYYDEDGRTWFGAIDRNGNEYETDEMPAVRLGITLIRLQGEWNAAQAREYLGLASPAPDQPELAL